MLPFTFLALAVVVYWLLVMVAGTVLERPAVDVAGLRSAVGLGGLPASLVATLLIGLAWVASLLATAALVDGPADDPPGRAASVGIVLGALALAWAGSAMLAVPIRRALRPGPRRDPAALVGRVCVVRSAQVGPDHGEAEVTGADGSPVVIEVRQAGSDELRPGSTALIHDYDADHRVFWVTAFEPQLGTNL
ncbi:hypothetical protein [Jiangella asiatica]|uniref:hypothetical protein n=1 Tax=Jiangella asiatica TaxID=2530372 RepID=UPI0013A5D0DC|nr:hypothetical protein [Jiangella asiatica]